MRRDQGTSGYCLSRMARGRQQFDMLFVFFIRQAEAMELELRYTLESFEGQLSAMAREKVAIQKQVKELTGQCATLRRQVRS